MMSRADNLIIFGMPEVESLPAIKRSVDELLTFIVCKSVPLHDVSEGVQDVRFVLASTMMRVGNKTLVNRKGPGHPPKQQPCIFYESVVLTIVRPGECSKPR